jgi:hypothetical protein
MPDLFAGRGSTLIAEDLTGRLASMMELGPLCWAFDNARSG